MTERPTTTVNPVPVKGDAVAIFATGHIVEMWFQSPTGDRTDAQIFRLTCSSEEQACSIAARHQRAWGLS